MDHSVVRRWLRQVLGPYPEQDRVYADVDRLLLSVSSLSPKTDAYTYDDGRTALLLCLNGTIPVTFRGATYNIPMAFWIPRTYPREPPLAYVTPTPDMLVRKGKDVDVSGRVGGEYLQAWERKAESCNLLELVQSFQQIFSREPPVYAKPVSRTSASTSAASPSASPSPAVAEPPRPSSAASTSRDPRERSPPPPPAPSGAGEPVAAQRTPAGPPAKPPKPGQQTPSRQSSLEYPQTGSPYAQQNGRGSPMYAGQPSGSSSVQRAGSLSGPHAGVQSPPPLPPMPPHQSHPNGFAPHHDPHPSQHYANHSAQHAGPSASYHPAQSSSSPQQRQSWHATTPQNLYQPSESAQYGEHRQPQTQAPPAEYQYAQQQHQPQYSQAQYDPSQPPAPPALPPHNPGSRSLLVGARSSPAPDLLDSLAHDAASASSAGAVVDNGRSGVPPSRPPNPELLALHVRLHSKISMRVQGLRDSLGGANSHLHVLASDLEQGAPAIHDEMMRLEAVRDVCKTTGKRLYQTVEAGRKRVEELSNREEPDVDGMICATSIVGNQLLDLVAEDNAIEDTLYYLGRALNSERIDLDRFLKQTRFLAREQFMRRALAQKIRDGMGWSTD